MATVYAGLTNVDSLTMFTWNDQGNGYGTLSYPNGDVLSVQPDGRNETRPAGTNGVFEKCRRISDTLVLFDAEGDPMYKGAAYVRMCV